MRISRPNRLQRRETLWGIFCVVPAVLGFLLWQLGLPSIVPAIASSVLWLWLFNPDFGLLNAVLSTFGIPKQQWIYDESTVLPSLIFMNLYPVAEAEPDR
jgi:multiple sugar transport system permease protein